MRLVRPSSLAAIALALCPASIGSAAAEPVPHVVSKIKHLRFVALGELPAAPARANQGDGCFGAPPQPPSEAARAVAVRGWHVIGDVPLGRYRAVSFASDIENGTSGTCVVHDGNVGVFDGGRLVALVYGKAGDDALGTISAGENDSVRIMDGDIDEAEIGILSVQADGILLLAPLPKEESVCGGRGTVPNIKGMPIDEARAALIAKGWTPVRQTPSTDPREQALVRQGVIEVNGCSGTGLGYCSFDYKGPAGSLSVTTIGEADMPEVIRESVHCQ